jgi:signal transduction histidine kinase
VGGTELVSRAGSGAGRPFSRFRPTGAQLNWLLRLVELPVVVGLAALTSPGFGAPLVIGLLALAGAGWVAWLVLTHWKTTGTAAGRLVWPALLLIAAAGGLAAMATGGSVLIALAVIVALHAGTTMRPWTVVSVPVAGVVGTAVGVLIAGGYWTWVTGTVDALLIVGGAIGGLARGLRIEQLRQSRLLLAQQQQMHAARERAAALAERARIARDIHDVLAHSLADLSIQLEVADALLSDAGDGSGALRHVRRAHRLAADGLQETRRVVHALRSDLPTLPDALAAMTGAYREDGGAARFELAGSPRPLPSAVGLALVRTAQEAMANARKHAAGRSVTIALRFDADRVALTVADDDAADTAPVPQLLAPDGVGGGYGLAGMRERLRMVGGSLVAGPADGGWRVHAEVPA